MVAFGFYIFLFWAVFLFLDPFYTGYGAFRVTRDIGPFKYFSLFVGFFGGFLAFVAIRLRGQKEWALLGRSLFSGVPIFFLGTYVLIGSVYARAVLHIQESFLPVGVSMIGFLFGVLFYFGSLNKQKIVQVYFSVLLACSVFYIIPTIVVKRLQSGQAFHTEIFLVIPLCVYFFLILRSPYLRFGILLLMTGTAFALHKNLGYINLAGSLIYLYVLHYSKHKARFSDLGRFLRINFALTTLSALIAVVTFLYIYEQEYVPSGNVEVRQEVYSYALSKFYNHPFFGDYFTGSSIVYLKDREVLGRHHVTTHSDWLDVLSHGGLFGMIMYLSSFAFPIKRSIEVLLKYRHSPRIVGMHGLLAVTFGGVVVSMFVSLFTSTQVAILYWFNLGMLSAVTVHVESEGNQSSEYVPQLQ